MILCIALFEFTRAQKNSDEMGAFEGARLHCWRVVVFLKDTPDLHGFA